MTNTPLTPLTMAILLALAERARHGYALMQEVGGQLGAVPGTGSLYAALQRLAEAGLIEESAGRTAAADDGRRRVFRITRAGRAEARREAQRLLRVVETARQRALLPEVR